VIEKIKEKPRINKRFIKQVINAINIKRIELMLNFVK